uniref:Uncharacterized protein n=1 Tax=Tetranychus urticae TaxID=32264 RepID=T1KBE4_TETUR
MEYCLFYRNRGLPAKQDKRWKVCPVSEIRPFPPATCVKAYDRILVKDSPQHICFAYKFASKATSQHFLQINYGVTSAEFGKQATLRTYASKVQPTIEKKMLEKYSSEELGEITFDDQEEVEFEIVIEESSQKRGRKSKRPIRQETSAPTPGTSTATSHSNQAQDNQRLEVDIPGDVERSQPDTENSAGISRISRSTSPGTSRGRKRRNVDPVDLSSLWKNLGSFKEFDEYCSKKLDADDDRNSLMQLIYVIVRTLLNIHPSLAVGPIDEETLQKDKLNVLTANKGDWKKIKNCITNICVTILYVETPASQRYVREFPIYVIMELEKRREKVMVS